MSRHASSSSASRPLSFLFVVPRFHTNLAFAVRGLVAAGHKVAIACPKIADNEDHSVIKPIRLTPRSSWRDLAACLRATAPDVVLVRRVSGLSGRLAYLSHLRGAITVAYDQEPDTLRASIVRKLHNLVRGRPWRRMTPVRGLDRGAADRYTHYIPFPVATTDSEPRPYAPNSRTRILCVGKLSQPRKRHLDIVEALAPLCDMYDFALTIVGGSALTVNNASAEYLAQIRALDDGAALAGRVTVHEDVPFEEMASLYRDHDLCILPSVGESLGVAPLEATAHGCVPIIAEGCGSAGSITAEAGATFPAGDIDALRAILTRFLSDPAALACAGAAARQLAMDELSMPRYVARMEALARRR